MGVAGLLPPNAESTFFSEFGNFGQHRLTIDADRDGNGEVDRIDSANPLPSISSATAFPPRSSGMRFDYTFRFR
ncbi:hypothetical protein HFO76_13105 [Rhizobium laguerreae]|nr:hypothetical protein [Rhizobium laguerreae]